MKKQLQILAAVAITASVNAQVVGDPALGTYNFDNNELMYTGSTPQYHPKVNVSNGETTVVWGHGTSGQVGIFHTELNSTTYQSVGAMDTVVGFTGILASDADALFHTVGYDASVSKYLSTYRFSDNLTVVAKDFSIKGKLYSGTDFSTPEIVIEGPFDYSSDRSSTPSIASNGAGKFCLAYHSEAGNSTASVIRVKFVDATTGAVTPASQANTQTGTSITFPGALKPSVAYNAASDVYGIVYRTGAGNNSKIKFISVDGTGAVVTNQKNVLTDNQISYDYPKLKEDGAGFVMTWVDSRGFQIPGNTAVNNPQIRIAKLSVTGALETLTGPANVFDGADNSLLLSNPYEIGTGFYHEVLTIVPGQKYASIWSTQDTPTKIQMTEIHVTTGAINAMVPIQLNQANSISDRPSLSYDGTKYVAVFNEYNGSTYENRIAVGEFEAGNGGGGSTSILENNTIVSVFPNPSTGIINLSEVHATITLMDINGKTIETFTSTNQLDLSSYEKGVYLIQTENGAVGRVSIIK